MKNFLAVCVLLMAALPALAAEETSAYDRVIAKNELVCGVIPWAPFKEYDSVTKEWRGFAIDLYRTAFATLDIKVVYKEVILGNQVQDLNSGRVDAICDDGPYILSMGKFVEYSDPLYAAPVYPYIRKSDTRFKTRADFNNEEITFTGIDGDLSSDLAKRLFPKARLMSMPGTTDVAQLFLNVAAGKADVAIVDPGTFEVFDRNNPGKLVPLPGGPLTIYKAVIDVKKGDFKMLGLVNQAVDNALAFGVTNEVLDGFDPERKKLKRVRPRFMD